MSRTRYALVQHLLSSLDCALTIPSVITPIRPCTCLGEFPHIMACGPYLLVDRRAQNQSSDMGAFELFERSEHLRF